MRSPHLPYLGPAVAENRDDDVLQEQEGKAVLVIHKVRLPDTTPVGYGR